jgi:protein-tyrosine-phosphatase/DNA-binding transcriptional ArsR family regulator
MELVPRARVHAALGEPVRLAIVERLVNSDLTPGELGEQLDVPTNLMAHHLRTLVDAEVVRRMPSAGDRRRVYVHLRQEDPAIRALVGAGVDEGWGLAPPAPRVVFVCTHNAARSQLAAAAWDRVSAVPATSAGTHPVADVHPRTVRVGRHHGLTMAHARTRDLTSVARPGDLIVSVCDAAHEEIDRRIGPLLHWSVPDPVPADTDQAFEEALGEISSRVDRLAHSLAHSSKQSSPTP